ncbi:MAG TPA: peptidylprolyl isomerase [Limnobacter sp.]|uniref:peptidylprolyl isomerase n=1 Tax=Limnobacter sp. TaxID=2003368 RepID=UPI002ED8D48F
MSTMHSRFGTPLMGILLGAALGLPLHAVAQSLKMPQAGKPATVIGAPANNTSPAKASTTPSGITGKLSGTLGESTQSAPEIDGIVAIVNSDIITRSELNRQVAQIERQMTRRGVQLPDRLLLRKQVLDRMINDRAQLQLANDTGIRVDDAQVDATMARIAEQNNMSMESFMERLRDDGVSPTRFREEVKNEMTVARLRERDVESRIQVSDAEIQAFLASKTPNGPANKPEVNWVQFLIKAPQDASGNVLNQAQTKAAAVEKMLKAGASTADVLKAYPELAIAGTGAMGWQGYDAVPSLFTEFLSKADTNGVSTVRSPNGFHVLKVLERRDGATSLDATPVTQTHARHILIKTGPDISDTEAKRRLNFALEQLKNGQATFEDLAKRYSQDGSASKGGDLGWLYPGDTVPEFEREMNQLPVGGISPVFQSRFGFHIVQVTERRQQAASEERQRQAARQAIRANKAEEAYNEWLRQLRDRTYVDIRL